MGRQSEGEGAEAGRQRERKAGRLGGRGAEGWKEEGWGKRGEREEEREIGWREGVID